MIKVHNSVSIILYNSTKKSLVFVKQFRPAIYMNEAITEPGEDGSATVDTRQHPGSRGLSYELCAGIVDKNKPLAEIAQDEILEECGYAVPIDRLEKVATYRTGIGTSGAMGTMFYAEVDDSMVVSSGGGNLAEGELIEVVHLPAEEALDFLWNDAVNKPGGVLMAVMWFCHNKLPKIKQTALAEECS
ncbi:PREDICTED: uridine diphosphate glucose pyrophosphatase-like [Priapulus caudatus]|uniref:Uridine diphosphate glucose pyrophosphatase-like n=1 Tax=Priapulus caudatus TaxID=37621 RepID=A0ABM1EQS3_PRICU|nr:PREDICTED: uridine diphosphate glucose pyrophosphatase-like [Priapulus caudatus]